MTSLRMRVVEAGARAYEQECHGMADDATWEALKAEYPDDYADMLREMGAAFDAMLDCLTENMNEWIAEERQLKADAWSGATIEDVKPLTSVYVVHDLIATLREPTDG